MKKFIFVFASLFVFSAVSNVVKAENEATVNNEVVDYSIDWTQKEAYTLWGQGGQVSLDAETGLKIINTEATDNWKVQYQISSDLPTKTDSEYTLKLVVKASAEGQATVCVGGNTTADRASVQIDMSTDFQELTFPFTAKIDGGKVLIQFGKFMGTVSVKSVKIVHQGTSTGISQVGKNMMNADAPIYNLNGQIVGKGYKGIAIKNGKKFICK